MKKTIYILIITIISVGCTDLLDEKPSTDLVIPDNLEDLRGLLDNDSQVIGKTGGLHVASSDDFYLQESGFQNVQEIFLGSYLLNAEQIEQFRNGDWENPYQQIFYCNVVLEELGRINPSNSELEEYNDIKGAALFLRAFNYFHLAVQFVLHPDNPQMDNTLGLPLKKEADVNIQPNRSTVAETFDFIFKDMNEASPLLRRTSTVNTRPSIHCLEALYARVYLYLGEFELALQAANSALEIKEELIDYNVLNASASRPFPRGNVNPEIIFNAVLISWGPLRLAPGSVNPILYDSYESNDLRKSIFFNVAQGFPLFKGTYTGILPNFSGLATDEMFLIAAEASARLGDSDRAFENLNKLMRLRYQQGSFDSFTSENTPDVLKKVLEHRRKQLVVRGLRWYDFKRLAFDSENRFEIVRNIGDQEFRLHPFDLMTAFPIPIFDIGLSGLVQNPR